MSKRKTAQSAAVDQDATPDRGGAWIRLADGSLVRDPEEDQHDPDAEEDQSAHASKSKATPPSSPPSSRARILALTFSCSGCGR